MKSDNSYTKLNKTTMIESVFMDQNEIYENQAEFYDEIYGGQGPIDEHVAYKLLMHAFEKFGINKSSAILDMGAGTGRLLLPLTMEGYKIDGMEPFPQMRRIANDKAVNRGVKINIMDGKFETLNEENKYDMIFALNGTFAYVYSTVDAIKSFKNIRSALKPGGIFILDIMNFYNLIKNYRHPSIVNTEVLGNKARYFMNYEVDPKRSVWIHDLHCYIETDHGIQYLNDYQKLALISPREVELLCHLNQLTIIEYHTSYDEFLGEEKPGNRCLMIIKKN